MVKTSTLFITLVDLYLMLLSNNFLYLQKKIISFLLTNEEESTPQRHMTSAQILIQNFSDQVEFQFHTFKILLSLVAT